MAVNGRTTNISRSDILEVGDRFDVPGMSVVVDEVLEAVARWADFASEAEVPTVVINDIADDIQQWSNVLR
jgi:hypothetical protein